MHRVGTRAHRSLDERLGAQVRVDRHRLVRLAHERQAGVGLRVDGDGGDPERARRPADAPRDLAAVGNE